MTPDVEVWFGHNVRRLRQKHDMSQYQLAREMTRRGHTMHQVTLGKIENAVRPTRIAEVYALADILQVELMTLLEPASPCEQCGDTPPGGYTCNTCGRSQ